MKPIIFEITGEIEAPAELVYQIIADYRDGHPHIVPKKYFKSLTVEQGGIGKGTIFVTETEAFGRKQTMRMHVTEPSPGSVLVETDYDSGIITTFTVTPDGEQRSKLTLHTRAEPKPGLMGLIERFLSPGLLRKMYLAEFETFNQYLRSNQYRAQTN